MRVLLNEKGRRIGESHANARYTDHEVELMRDLYEEGMRPGEIAKKFDAPVNTVRAIVLRISRIQIPFEIREVKDDPNEKG